MLVRHFMTRDVTSLDADMLCVDAWQEFVDRKLRRAPVQRAGKVIGMVTDRDLMRVLPVTVQSLENEASRQGLTTTLGALRRRDLIHVGPADHLERAAHLMLEQRIGGLPVLDGDELVGIITESDLFRVFVKLKERSGGTRLTLHWPPGESVMPDPARLALATGVEIREQLRHASPVGGELVGLRVLGGDIEDFQERLIASGFQLIDREVFEEPEA